MKILGIIPARYGSTRLPGKPLAGIAGKPMIQHVYERSIASVLDDVMIATDDDRIFEAVKKFGGKVIMTRADCQSGTERCAEAIVKTGDDFDAVINIQGDEPMLETSHLELLSDALKQNQSAIVTLITPVNNAEDLFQPSVVKVVLNYRNEALYFSRSVIPFLRNFSQEEWVSKNIFYKHIGMYGYRAETLKEIAALSPSSLEQAESLEQLRWLENGFTIQCLLTDKETISVDTPEDLERLERLFVK